MNTRPSVVILAAITAGAFTASSLAVEVRPNILVKTGDPVPALGAGFIWQSMFTGLADHVISDQNFIAFSGVIAGPGVDATNSTVLAAGPIGGPYRIVARSGQPAPGAGAGVVFNLPVYPFLAESGRVLFYSTLSGPGVTLANDTGVWLESDPPGAAPLPVLVEGAAAPGLPGVTIAGFDLRMMSFQPRFQLFATPAALAGPGVTTTNNNVLYHSSIAAPSALTVLARSGDLIPTQVGVTYGTFGGACYAGGANSVDLVARGVLVGAGITVANDGCMLLYQQGSAGPGVVIRESGPIPGVSGGTYNQLLVPYALPTGEIGYFGTITGVATPYGATWVGSRFGASGGTPRGLPERGTPAPGFPMGSIMTTAIIDRFDVASTGRAVYGATCSGAGVTTANDTGLFSEAPGGIGVPSLLMREGDVPPGLVAPSAFSGVNTTFQSVAINSRHHAAFFAVAQGIGTPDPVSDTGLWVADAAGTVQLVAHRTRPFALSPTDTRTPTVVGYRVFSGPQRPGRRWLLDDGRMIVPMTFTDNTSALMVLHIDPPPLCRADFNNDGDDTLQNLFDFLVAWFAQDSRADLNGVDGVSVQDLFDYLVLWFAGCP